GRGMMPTVTNVNNASLLTGLPPADHGISGNYFLDDAGQGTYMESPGLLRAPLIFSRIQENGGRTVMISSKRKLVDLFGGAAGLAFSVEQPVAWAVAALGGPPPIYSIEANLWLLRAARLVLERERPDLLYVTSTDYYGHMLPPEAPACRAFFAEADRLIGDIVDTGLPLSIGLTADHGMNRKTRAIDPARVLHDAGIEAVAVPALKDKYTKHHNNLSGVAYVYLNAFECGRAAAALASLVGVERVLTREEAVTAFHLPADRIGDLMLLGDIDTVFGEVDEPEVAVDLRSHGSLHEIEVPLISWGPAFAGFVGLENRALGATLWTADAPGSATV
ncbi:MAG: alkaline phosphatase family protein, partial [Dehalococcoidia bacterium]